jgi:ferritin
MNPPIQREPPPTSGGNPWLAFAGPPSDNVPMIISKKMNAALNQQVGNEFGASLQYVSIAAYFSGEGLTELANHFYQQASEEREHAMRFVKYIVDAGGHLSIPAVSAPKSSFKGVAEAVKLSLDWERTVTKQINDLVNLAGRENDHISENFLTWFVNEQLEELTTMDNLLKVVKLAGNNLLYVEEYVARHGITKNDGGAGHSPAK